MERDVDVELVRDPQPHSKVAVRGVAGHGDKACHAVGRALAGVVDGDHDMVGRGPDAHGRGRAAMALHVGDRLGDTNQQVLDDGAGGTAAGDPCQGVPGIGGGPVDQLGQRRGGFQRIGRVRQAFEDQGILVAAAFPALSGRRDDARVRALDYLEHRRRRSGDVVQAPAPHRKVLPHGVDGRLVAVPPLELPAVARMGHIPGDPDLPGAHGHVKLEQPPVGGDRPGRLGVQARIPGELGGGRIAQPRPQQGALTVVITENDRLARGDALLRERHDQGAELGVGAVETGLVEVARLAAGGASPHHNTVGSLGSVPDLITPVHRNIPSAARYPVAATQGRRAQTSTHAPPPVADGPETSYHCDIRLLSAASGVRER